MAPQRVRKPVQPAIHPFDLLHGTDTSGLISGQLIAHGTDTSPDDLTAYYGIAPSILRGLLDLWLQTLHPRAPLERTVFLDVGAGKGRAMLVASEYPFLRVEGVELNPVLASTAAANISLLEREPASDVLAPLRLHQGDATRHPLPPEPLLAHLFHPFEARLLRRFLRHLERSLSAHPRPCDLMYVNAEHDSLLDRHPAFERIWMGRVPMSTEDHLADLAAIAEQQEYGSTGDELCAVYRFIGRGTNPSRLRTS
ncbi:MAG TPA: class I SAM-dependent methyltransferase [Acidobacteriaceae bacterium]|nr:class I SAM-dependent methyltransferase [Acidobacteriaceae bacterium]